MNYSLPSTVELSGKPYPVRTDFRAVLDICAALSDPNLSKEDKIEAALVIFYPDFDELPPSLYEEAARECFLFINCGEDEPPKEAPKLVDWGQDISRIIPPINRIAGQDIRAIPYDFNANTGGLHWWTFVGYYMEIGDCLFAQIVSIRNKLRRHKKLEKHEREFYHQNREMIDFQTKYSDEEDAFLRSLTGGMV